MGAEPIKALSLWQPWASLISLGAKWIETRSWSTSYRGPLAIHAAQTIEGIGIVDAGRLCREDDAAIAEALLARGVRTWGVLPLGAVVATCNLVDVVPITTHAQTGDGECIVVHDDGLDHAIPSSPPPPWPSNIVRLDEPDIPDGVHLIRDVSDQRPYGDFTPGRFAWILADIQPLAVPVPARGRQGLWNWTPQDHDDLANQVDEAFYTTLVGGEKLLFVHDPSQCANRPCCIHNPSDHHMRDWPQHWRDDRRIMERICPDNGIGHPDPDGLLPAGDNGTHGCDGCCRAESA